MALKTSVSTIKKKINGKFDLLAATIFYAVVAERWRAERMWRSHLKAGGCGGKVLAVPIKWVTPRTKYQPHVCGQRPHGWSTAGGGYPLNAVLFDPLHTVDLSQPAGGLTLPVHRADRSCCRL